jgi:GTP-binding protein HflX
VGLLSDTVGFIQQLPPRLIQAFKSTLSELNYADLLLHVVDASNPNWESHIAVVESILEEMGVDKKTLYVFNKSDKLQEDDPFFFKQHFYKPHVVISARNKETLTPLKKKLTPQLLR